MARVPWCEESVYRAAGIWVERSLREQRSLFTGEHGIWVADACEELERRIGEIGKASTFIGKLQDQLRGLPDKLILLGAEVLYVELLGETSTAGETKRAHIAAVLGLLPQPVTLDVPLADALDGGGVAATAPACRTATHTCSSSCVSHRRWPPRGSIVAGRPLGVPRLRQAAGPRGRDDGSQCDPAPGLPGHLRVGALELPQRRPDRSVLFGSHRRRGPQTTIARSRRSASSSPQRVRTPSTSTASPSPMCGDRLRLPGGRRWRSGPHGLCSGRSSTSTNAITSSGSRNGYGRPGEAVLGDADDWLRQVRRAFSGENNLTTFCAHGKVLDWCKTHEEQARDLLVGLWSDEPPREGARSGSCGSPGRRGR
jgi:hypothetical protein